jgi:chloramphenicol-sensitive protein RarD
VAANWFVYIWAVNAGRVVDASLGYFINPLVNVLIGAAFLHERLRPAQWAAAGVAAAGVGWLTWQAGAVPWIGLVLALTFGLYGLLRKTAALGAIEGLTLETVLLTPLAAAYLLWLAHAGASGFVEGDTATRLLLAAAGPVTAVPLLLFAAGARRIPFSTLGLLQYLGPSLQLLIGVWLYHEPFAARAPGYVLIWIALAVFSVEGLLQGWRSRAAR